ncbi:hypothetical protein DFH06DRAFT_692077 [Mycena polygramma]|nr:hypothetical protein DFH06DRAFT_692077 [Mycena polygramma]
MSLHGELHLYVDDDTLSSERLRDPAPPDNLAGLTSGPGCRVSRRLGTVSRQVEPPPQERPPSAKSRRIISRISRLKRAYVARALESGDSAFESDEDLFFILDRSGFSETTSPDSEAADATLIHSGSLQEDVSSISGRDSFTDPGKGDDVNCLNYFAVSSAGAFWSVDMRLTLLWCLAYEARFQRRGPALELWLAIIEGSRERVDWGMWEDGDELWLRNMILKHQMTTRFRVATSKLSPEDWMLARDALERRIGRPGPRPSGPFKTWSTQHRVLRIAWCAVTDGVPAAGKQYPDLMKSIDCWTYFTCPFRPSYGREMRVQLHDAPDCSLSSCKVGVWQWFKTAILDYDFAQVQDVLGCCGACITRALSAIGGSQSTSDALRSSGPSVVSKPRRHGLTRVNARRQTFSTYLVNRHAVSKRVASARPVSVGSVEGSMEVSDVREPAIWPVILWVTFQIQTCGSSSTSKNIDALLALIRSKSDEHRGLWSWDDTDEQMLRQNLSSPGYPRSSWVDCYPASWREYILLLGSNDWSNLEALTRASSRPPWASLEYETMIRIGAIVLWTSSNAAPESLENSILLSLEMFLPADLGPDNHEFLQCLLEGRAPVRANHYELNLGPETVDWHHPRIWLDRNRVRLRSSVLHDPDATSLVDVVENVDMVHHAARALPLRFMSSVFACLLRKFRGDERLDQFRKWITIWKTWDTKTCLINFRSVLDVTFEFSKLIQDHDLPMSLINVAIHTDIRCICAQFADILCNSDTHGDFLKTKTDDAQKLLDLLQDLLDYPLLDGRIRPVILKALLKLSATSGGHPRCFTLSDRLQLAAHPVAAGSFGDVWKGYIRGETVSVKVMRVYEETDTEALLKEFCHEALIWRQLSHPNLLPFFGAYFLEGTRRQLCLVSPWMENGDMDRYLKDNPVGVNRLSLVLDIALGLDHLHNWKLVHGDLKARNVLITRSGRAVLADFGLSSVTDSKIFSSASSFKSGGTMRWQAPELFPGGRNSFASDVYAFSCVCYEVFTGNVPFHDLPTDVAVMYQVMHGQRPGHSSSIPDDIWTLMTECWAQDPQDRLLAEQIVFRFRDRPICAVPTSAASDWDPWYTSKFRASLEEHTLFLSCGKIDDWLQFTQSENSQGIRSSGPIFSARSTIYIQTNH